MALALFDRVQETTTTTGTGSLTLAGAVAGFQSFAVVGNTNTCYYTIIDGVTWEVGVGTYSTTGPTLARTTVLSNSSGNTTPLTLAAGSKQVFLTYPASKSVNLNETGNVSALGTVSSGVWQGTTVGVAYGGTGVTTSSGANSVMLRDANQNVSVNRLNQANTSTAAAGGTTTLTAASTYSQTLTGTGTQTYQMPDATSIATGVAYIFNNNATGTLTLINNASGAIGTITAGGAAEIVLLANGTIAGTWDVHGYLPEAVTWGTNALALGTTIITGGTWNGGTITSAYGGTGLTTFTAANNALYSTAAGTLAAGTLPVLAGGTGSTTSTGSGAVVRATSPTLVTPLLGTPTSGNFSTGTFTWPTFNQNTTGSSASCTGNAATATTATTANALNSANSYTAVSFTATSDEHLKTNWRNPPADFLEQLADVKHGTFDRIDVESTQDGVSAQSLRLVLPHSVVADANGQLSVNYGGASLVSAIQLAQRVVEQEARINRLEALMAELMGE